METAAQVSVTERNHGGLLSILVLAGQLPATAGSRSPIASSLEELGHTVATVEDGPVELARWDALLMWGNQSFFPGLRRQLLATLPSKRPLVAVLHSEPLPPPKASGLPRWASLSVSEIGKILLRDRRATDIYTNAIKLRRAMRDGWIDLLFVTSGEKQEYAAEEGYESWYIPFGYHADLGDLLELERDVDVLFLGDTRPWRRRRLLRRLRRAGVAVTVRGSWHPDEKALWGDERTRFLNRTRIVVHIQRYPGKVAAIRFLMAMANGAMVVSEPAYRPEPFVDGEHFVAATVDEMPDVIRYYLAHPDERARITAAAHRIVTEELTLRRSMEKMLEVIRQNPGPRGAL